MKICVCIEGQLRSPERALPLIAEKFQGIDALFIFSVWDKAGRKSDGAMNIDQMPRVFDDLALTCLPRTWFGSDKIWKVLPALRESLSPSIADQDSEYLRNLIKSHFPNAIIDVEPAGLLNLEFAKKYDDKNSVKMLYKIWRAGEIRKGVEREKGKFDVLIRMRPDVVLNSVPIGEISEKIAKGKFMVNYWKGIGDYFVCGDSFAAGSSADMDAYGSTFSRSIDTGREWGNIHVELAKSLQSAGVKPETCVYMKGFYDESSKVNVDDLLACLEAPGNEATHTDVHDIVYHTCVAAKMLQEGRPEEALASLAAFKFGDTVSDRRAFDGYLHVLILILTQMGQYGIAHVLSSAVEDVNEFNPTSRRYLMDRPAVLGVHINPQGMPVVIASKDDVLRWFTAHLNVKHIFEAIVQQPVSTYVKAFGDSDWSQAFSIVKITPPSEFGQNHSRVLMEILIKDEECEEGDRIASKDDLNIILTKVKNSELDIEHKIGIFEQALLTDLNNLNILYPLADMLKLHGEYKHAATIQGRALDLVPSHAGAQRQMAEICAHIGDWGGAKVHISAAVNLHPDTDIRVLSSYIDWMMRGGTQNPTFVQLPDGYVIPSAYGRLPQFAGFERHILSVEAG